MAIKKILVSCYSFSSVSVLEIINNKKTKTLFIVTKSHKNLTVGLIFNHLLIELNIEDHNFGSRGRICNLTKFQLELFEEENKYLIKV